MKSASILPGATLGVLGSGQLGRMFALAARRLGYQIHVYSPDTHSPAGAVADQEFQGEYDDLKQVQAFAKTVQVVTFEFENIPVATADACAEIIPVRPSGRVLHTTQHRLREKTFLRDQGLPVTPFSPIRSAEDLKEALATRGGVGVLKTAAWGYDGKGQIVIHEQSQSDVAWKALKSTEGILETRIDFAAELSVVGVRGLDGSFASYGPLQNEHRKHILDVTKIPAALPAKLAKQAVEITQAVLNALDVVGVLCVEFFLTRSGELLINETAPRPHNSGHLTMDAHTTCQFEQQVRAICGLPLGSTELRHPAAMVNLLGEIWADGEPRWGAALADGSARLHLYGKKDPRPGRKMGHLTVVAPTVELAEAKAKAARAALRGEGAD